GRVSVVVEGRRLVDASARMNLQTVFNVLVRIVRDVVTGRQIPRSEIHLAGMRRIDGIGVDRAEPVDESVIIMVVVVMMMVVVTIVTILVLVLVLMIV